MLDVMERCFADRYQGLAAQAQGDGAVARHRPSGEPKLFEEVWDWGTKVLKLGLDAPTAIRRLRRVTASQP